MNSRNLPARRGILAAQSKTAALQDTFEQKMARLRQATGTPERFALACACARDDREFVVAMERFDSQKPYVIAAIMSPEKSAGSAFSRAPRRKTLPIGMVDTSGWRCLWCGHREFIACHDCAACVCGAKTWKEGGFDWFECRDSCGARSSLRPLEEISGTESARRGAARKASAPPGRFHRQDGSQLLLPYRSTKLLKR